MVYEQEKIALEEILKKYPVINAPATARLLKIPISRAKNILWDLEVKGFLKRQEIKIEKNVSRFWELNKTLENVDVENEQGISKHNST